MIFILISLIGMITFKLLPVEMMPNVSFGHISIYINVRGGVSATEIEKSIAKIAEEAVGSVTHLKDMLTISKEGNCTIILEFEPGSDMDYAALEVREKFNRIRNKLPKEVEKPVIAKYEYTDVPIVILAVTSKIRTPEELRKIVDETIKDRVQRVEGVARVEVAGGREGKIMIEVDKYRLQSLALPINKIVDTINVNNINLLAGEVKRTDDKYLVRTIGEFADLSEISELAVTATEQGSVIRVRDFAKVKDSFLDPTAFSRVNAQPSVSLYIQKESLANTVKVADRIVQSVSELQDKLDPDIELTFTSNQADYVKESIKGVKISLLLGALLAFSILFFFLRDIPVVFAIGCSIPISVAGTFFLMWATQLSLNLMTLSGLALGVGMLLDNSIVVIEHIYKKLEPLLRRPPGMFSRRPKLTRQMRNDVSITATEEVLLAIIASTVTTCAVFFPIVWVNPSIRILYSGLALTIIYALLVSLVCAVMLIPMIISKTRIHPQRQKTLFSFYPAFIKQCLKLRYILIALAMAVFVAVIPQFNKLEKEFIGVAEQNKFTIFIELPTGTRIDVTDEVVKKIEKAVAGMPEIKTVTAKVEPWSSKLYVELYPLAQRQLTTQQVIDKIRPFTQKMEPAFIYFEEEQEVGTKEIIIELFGYDYEVLKSIAVSVGQKMQSIPKFTDAKIRMREGRPEMHVRIDRAKAALLGLSTKDIGLALHTQLRGLVATQFRGNKEPLIKISEEEDAFSPSFIKQNDLYGKDAGKETETIVRLDEAFRKTFENLKRTTFVNPDGEIIYLSHVAEFDYATGPSEIWRKNKARMVQVSANTGGLALGTAGEKVKAVLKDLDLPKDYFWELGGNYEKMLRNQKELTSAIILSILLIYMILASLFESFSQPFIILISLPLAFIGAVMALRLTGKPVGIGVLIGAIMLGGIVVNNAIILIHRINALRSQNSKTSLAEIVITASTDRLRPIIMTSLTTIASMLFLALDKSESANLWSPLAITVIGGMSVSSLLTLIIVPSLYLIFDDFKHILVTKRR